MSVQGNILTDAVADKSGGGIKIVQESVRATDGSVALQILYTYESDAVGNWVKMVLSVATPGGADEWTYLPLQVTYRTITYYPPIATALAAGAPNTPPADSHASEATGAHPDGASTASGARVATSGGAKSAAPVEATPILSAATDGVSAPSPDMANEKTPSTKAGGVRVVPAASKPEWAPRVRVAPWSFLPLENGDVLLMVQAKVRAEEIIARIKASSCRFDTFPPVIEELRYRGVPDSVLAAMIEAPHGQRLPRTETGVNLQDAEALRRPEGPVAEPAQSTSANPNWAGPRPVPRPQRKHGRGRHGRRRR